MAWDVAHLARLMKETETGVQHHSQLVRSSCSMEQKAQEDGYPHPGGSCSPVSSGSLPLKSLRLFIGVVISF